MQDDAVQANDRQLKALTLRKAGVGYQAIADALGYKDHTGAWRAVKSALKRTLQEPADELRTLELARLDDMLKAIAPHVAAGNLTAIDRALKIAERRAKLVGLDAPVKQEVKQEGTTRVLIEYVDGNDGQDTTAETPSSAEENQA